MDQKETPPVQSSPSYTVPSEAAPDLFMALQRLKDDADNELEGNSILVRKGVHNLTQHGDIELDWEVHLMGESGAVLGAWAEPVITSPIPQNGGGRWKMSIGATGSTFRQLRWQCFNTHCAIIASSAVLFQVRAPPPRKQARRAKNNHPPAQPAAKPPRQAKRTGRRLGRDHGGA
jgi:hypothetical protein